MSNQSKGRAGGVLPIPAAATKKSSAPQKSSQRSPAPKLRLIIRRLPPGLTASEFWEAVGPEWQVGNGKVDWQAFKEGKISKDPSKPSRPGRAYLKVKDQSLLEALSAKIKVTQFKDVKNTANDPCLVGPPSLEFAPYNKVPSGRNRHDGRQGTIDQDQEFIDFLQSLTEPIVKPTINGADSGEPKQEKASITPLVQFIKEKKANKAKEKEAAAAAKTSKKNQDGKEGKAKSESRPTVVVKSNAAAAEKAKIAKATQEAVKAANKSATQAQSKTPASKSEPKSTKEVVPPAAPAAATPTKPERQRGNASAASRMIARDLGLAPKEPRTPRGARNASAASTPATENKSKAEPQQQVNVSIPAAATTAATTKPAVTGSAASATSPNAAPPTGPRNQKSGQTQQAKQAQQATQRPSKAPPQPTPGAKSAFLKHANPSQGVTEELLRTTFSTYGEVTRCEIDKKKGLGYVDFTDTESLKKAMAASPVKIGNGQVIVLENKSPYQKRQPQQSNSSQVAGSGANTSRAASVVSSAVPSAVTSPQPAPAVIATAESAIIATAAPATSSTAEPTPATETAASSSAPATPTTPNTPKGGRGGNAAARGQRGGAGFPAGRGGGFGQSPNRGRAGAFRGRGGRGGRSAGNAATAAAGASSAPATPVAGGSAASAPAGGESAKPAAADSNKT